MSYKTAHDSSYFTVIHPQLNTMPGEQKTGLRRFNIHKNIESEPYLYTSPSLHRFQPFRKLEPLDNSSSPSPTTHHSKSRSLSTVRPFPQIDVINGKLYESQLNQSYEFDRINKSFDETTQRKNKSEVYEEEIRSLKEKIKKKEEEFFLIKRSASGFRNPYHINSYEKSLYDLNRNSYQKEEINKSLDYQMGIRQKRKELELWEKDREKSRRFEDMKILNEIEMRKRIDEMIKKKMYSQELNNQELQNGINKESKNLYSFNKKSIDPSSEYLANAMNFPRHTKKTAKTICYNPITNVIQDTSDFLFDQPTLNAQYRVSALPNEKGKPSGIFNKPALYNPLYTKLNPKISPTYPITGYIYQPAINQDFAISASKFFGCDSS
ncbi:unnamed protein product [Blepharisma stoltei]|uniref:Uncharacterized protein n=1 Tax=Blepharisma stoltei TaxID=1481888 RepID=A0AAU9JJG7_9CILI|nr:unnamed protein product [Blepharisma stoltei]